ncbi:MAG: methylmalonyl-CoA epimerase [Haliea sp.]|nr:MAG: methylmalonyl-CoA epimerase [Haliea sp.]
MQTVATSDLPTPTGAVHVDHLGIAVADLASAVATYQAMLGVAPVYHHLPAQGISVAMFQLANLRIELLAPVGAESPITNVLEDHTIQAFIGRHPAGGLHHVCYVVDDLDMAQPPGARRLGSGVPLIGAQGKPIVFLDPATTGGALIELKQSG